MNNAALRRPFVLFAMTAVAIAAACLAILRSQAFAGHPDVMAWAVTFDLTLTIPLLYYFVVIRTGAARLITLVPIFVLCATFAAIVLPHGYQQTLHDLRFLIAPFEVLTIVLLVRRILAVRGSAEPQKDPYERIEQASQQAFGNGPAAGFVASEVAVVWYAIFGWSRRAEVLPDARTFTVHERSGWSSIVVCFIVLIVAESIGVHLLVQLRSVTAAWIVTALDLYGILWLLGDYNALRLRPSIVKRDVLLVRYGLRWSVTIPAGEITAIRCAKGEADWKHKDVLKVAMIDEPRMMIELARPFVAKGLAGFRKTIRAIAISPDDDDALLELDVERTKDEG